jgi:glutathione S-transferase
MARLKLLYFDIDGGRGEPARLALHIGGVAFEDQRVVFSDWPAIKPQMPYQALPVLEIDGRQLAQSNSINRFVGKLTGLYPKDPWQAALCDEIMDVVEDSTRLLAATFGIKNDDEKKAARQALVDGPLRLSLQQMQTRLEQSGGEYFADNRLTVADLKVFAWIKDLKSGHFDYIPTDLTNRVAPLLIAHFERVNADPKVAVYYASR